MDDTSETEDEEFFQEASYSVTQDVEDTLFIHEESEDKTEVLVDDRSEFGESVLLSEVEDEAVILSNPQLVVEGEQELEGEATDVRHTEEDVRHLLDHVGEPIPSGSGERIQDGNLPSTLSTQHSSVASALPSLARTNSLTPSQAGSSVSTKSSKATPPTPAKSLKAASHVSAKFIKAPSVDRLKIVRPESKPCVKDRMRDWLNRDHKQPAKESFLGKPYSERDGRPLIEDPCSRIFFSGKRNDATSQVAPVDEEEKRKLCACGISPDLPVQTVSVPKLFQVKPKDGRHVCQCADSSIEDGKGTRADKINATLSTKFSDKELTKKLEICTCRPAQKLKLDAPKNEDVFSTYLQKKRNNLIRKWAHQKRKACHCRKSGWMSSRRWPKGKKAKCICKSLDERRKQFIADMKMIQNEAKDEEIRKITNQRREEKIEELYKAIGPSLAAEYRAMAKKCQQTQKRKPDSYEKSILAEFGDQLRKFRQQNLESGMIFRECNRSDNSSFQYMEYLNGTCYYGQLSPLGLEGKCIYKMAHGPIFVGTMLDGKMEGPGRLIYPNGGTVDGIWVNGTLFEPSYTFRDGLKFQPNNWNYCRMPDRRFVSEIVKGMNSPDNTQLCANHPARQIPKGCLDAGEGFYDPQKKVILHPCTGKTIRIVGEQEAEWIMKTCRREWFEEVPFSRRMYENWYAGTVFPQPKDEADWFESEFPKVILPYENVDDVIQARKMAMMAGLGASPEMSFTSSSHQASSSSVLLSSTTLDHNNPLATYNQNC